jgi:dTDP-4-amino-4,6-dideoxygalactose transaminase
MAGERIPNCASRKALHNGGPGALHNPRALRRGSAGAGVGSGLAKGAARPRAAANPGDDTVKTSTIPAPVPQASLALDGGSPVRTRSWPTYDKGDVVVDEDDVAAVTRAVRSRLLFRYDRRPFAETEVGRFEAALAKRFGVRHALAVSSGTAAIAVSLMAAGVQPGSHVAVPGFGFPATASAIRLAGGVPVLIEVDEDLHFDVADLERKITPQMKAVVVVHMRGFVSDVDAIVEVADRHGLVVVEDAVPALGAGLRGRPAGTLGRAGAFSTQSDKSLNTGEGGFLLTDDTELFGRALVLSGAFEGRYKRHFEGGVAPAVPELSLPLYNFRMDEVRGALAASQLEKLDTRVDVLRANYHEIAAGIAGLPEIHLRRPVSSDAFLGEALVFRLPGASREVSTWFAKALRAEGIEARAFASTEDLNVRCYWTWRFLFPGMSEEQIRQVLPRTTALLDETIDVPLAQTLSAEDIADVIEAITKVCRALRRSRAAAQDPVALAA